MCIRDRFNTVLPLYIDHSCALSLSLGHSSNSKLVNNVILKLKQINNWSNQRRQWELCQRNTKELCDL